MVPKLFSRASLCIVPRRLSGLYTLAHFQASMPIWRREHLYYRPRDRLAGPHFGQPHSYLGSTHLIRYHTQQGTDGMHEMTLT
jgi:hypothetical protein